MLKTSSAVLNRIARVGAPRPNAAPVDAPVLAAADRLGVDAADLRFERMRRDALFGRSDPMVALLDGGDGVAIETRDGARVALGPDGDFAPAREARALERYSGWALTTAAAGDPALEARLADLAEDLAETNRDGRADRRLLTRLLRATLEAADGRAFAALFMAAILVNLAAFAIPVFTMTVYDRVIPHDAAHTLIALTVGVAIILAVDLGLRLARSRLFESVGADLSVALASAAFGRLNRLALAKLPRKPARLSSALTSLEALATTSPQVALGVLVDLPFALLMLVYVGYLGGAIVVAPILAMIAVVAVNLIGHAAASRAAAASIGASDQRAGLVEEMLGHAEAVKLRGSLLHLDRMWRRLTEDCATKGGGVRLASGRAAQLTVTVTNSATIAVIVIGAILVKLDALTIGGLVACSILVNRALAPTSQTVIALLRFAQLAQATRPALALFDAEIEAAGDPTRVDQRPSPRLVFREVGFVYPGARSAALEGVSLEIAAGERVGLIGRVGSGKSTLLRLAPRLYDPTSGVIEYGERNLASYDPSDLRDLVSSAPQDPSLFDDSIYENLVFGLENIDAERFQEAVRVSGVFDMIKRKAEGYAFQIGPGGRRLSAGERQTVSLARALAQPFSMLLLDEPTASFDTRLETAFIEALPELLGDATLILSTHRAPALALVDRVVVMEEGRVIADGPRVEILARLRGAAPAAAA